MTLLCFLFAFFCMPVAAENREEETLPPEYDDFVDALPDSVLELLPEDIYEDNASSQAETASKISTPAFLLSALLKGFGASLEQVLPTAVLLVGFLMFSALFSTLSGNFGGSLGRITDFALRLVGFCLIAGLSLASLSRLKDYFASLFSAVTAFLPLSATLYAMGGNLTAAASSSLTLSTILTVCQFVCTKTVIPVFCFCLALSMLSAFEGAGSFAGATLSATLKKNYLTALSFVAMLLTSSLATQSILSAKSDNAAMRGVKFAVSGFVPVTGGAVSSTLGTLATSVELLRGAVGVIGIVTILLLLLPVVLELAMMRGVFGIASFLAGLLGCSSEKRLLDETTGLYGFLEGVALLSAVIFLIAMAVFASVSAAVV